MTDGDQPGSQNSVVYTASGTCLKIKVVSTGNKLNNPQLRSPPPTPNFRLTLSQQAPSSTNSHQNSNTRDIPFPLSPQPNNSPRQQKQTGRCRARETERKGVGEEDRKKNRGRRRIAATEGGERVSEKGRRHNNRRGKLRRSRETWKTLTIGER